MRHRRVRNGFAYMRNVSSVSALALIVLNADLNSLDQAGSVPAHRDDLTCAVLFDGSRGDLLCRSDVVAGGVFVSKIAL